MTKKVSAKQLKQRANFKRSAHKCKKSKDYRSCMRKELKKKK